MEYSSSCAFPTKLVSEYDVFLFFSFFFLPQSGTLRDKSGERGKDFLCLFFSPAPFYQPEFALSLCDLIFLVVKKEQVKLEKNSMAATVVYYLSAEQPTKCTG